jgi:hypothetical protein
MTTEEITLAINFLTFISLIFVFIEFFKSLTERKREVQIRILDRYMTLYQENYNSIENSEYFKIYSELLNISFYLFENLFRWNKKKNFYNLMTTLFKKTLDYHGSAQFKSFSEDKVIISLRNFSESKGKVI